MVFASLIFLYIFLPLNLILYYMTKQANWRNIILTLFSFVFYAWGEPVWIFLLIFSSSVDYLNALYIAKHRGTRKAKLGIVSSVIFNIGLLMVFKYSGFLYENLNAAFGWHLQVPKFTLPIGISFYTFQSVSYVIDVYRGEVVAQRSLLKFLMFVSLYHQLVAGPIVRYQHIMNEIDNRRFNIKDISSGIHRFCIGLFKKVCIANVAAGFVKGLHSQRRRGLCHEIHGWRLNSSDNGRSMVRCTDVLHPDLFRFLGLFGYGNRPG
jgi:alginate O-acetyltransferase complex protein AlgI